MMKIKYLLVVLLVLPTAFASAEEGWDHQSELAIILSGGNSDSKSVSFSELTSYSWTSDVLKLSGRYLVGASSGVLSSRQWGLGLRYEHIINDKFSVFVGPGVEGDTFAGYVTRINADLGGKYTFFNTDKKNYFFNETGYRYSSEKRVPSAGSISITSHYLRTYFELAHTLSESTFFKLWLELLPDLSNSSNFLMNFEPSFNVIMSNHLSLKLAYLGKFDNQPAVATNSKLDYTFTTALVADF